ncbi:MAG TPA: SMP-30/gluconolactonase/LRE family protein [Burkholderiales bacterium]|nr:SMP-30/gluconolactonase/LRE family protein [Burkholderiales bacterium]
MRAFTRLIGVVAVFSTIASATATDMPPVSGMLNPESVVVGADGRIYVSEIGEFGKNGDGKISVIDKSGRRMTFTAGLDDPKGLIRWKQGFFVTDKNRIWKIDGEGHAKPFVNAADFPQPPLFLNDLTMDSRGNLYVSDSGDILGAGNKGAIFKITHSGKVSLVINEAKEPRIKSPNGLLFERPGKLLVVDFTTGELNRLDVAKLKLDKIADGFGGGDGLARSPSGMLYVSDWKGGRVWKLDLKRSNSKPQAYAQAFQSAGDISLSRDRKHVLVPDMKAGTLTWLPN